MNWSNRTSWLHFACGATCLLSWLIAVVACGQQVATLSKERMQIYLVAVAILYIVAHMVYEISARVLRPESLGARNNTGPRRNTQVLPVQETRQEGFHDNRTTLHSLEKEENKLDLHPSSSPAHVWSDVEAQSTGLPPVCTQCPALKSPRILSTVADGGHGAQRLQRALYDLPPTDSESSACTDGLSVDRPFFDDGQCDNKAQDRAGDSTKREVSIPVMPATSDVEEVNEFERPPPPYAADLNADEKVLLSVLMRALVVLLDLGKIWMSVGTLRYISLYTSMYHWSFQAQDVIFMVITPAVAVVIETSVTVTYYLGSH